MSKRIRRPIYALGIIERHDNHILIARHYDDGPSYDPSPDREEIVTPWRFPRGPAEPDESPEAAMRRIARTQLEIGVEVVVGQPPVIGSIDGREAELRFFFCGVTFADPCPGFYREFRWVPRGQLSEYDFDAVSKPVVEWLLEQHR